MYPQLTDYIKQAKGQGVSDEQIKTNLLSAGWSDQDIKTAMGTPQNAVPLAPLQQKIYNPTVVLTTAPKSEHISPKVIFFVLFLVALGGGGYYFYINYLKTEITPSIMTGAESPAVNQIPVQPLATSDQDIERVKIILEEMRQGYLSGDESLIIKHASAETAGFFSSEGKIVAVRTFTVNNITQSGLNIIANVTATPEGIQNMVFVKENGDWKFDITATLEYFKDQNNAKKGTGDPNGLPDIVVIGATVYPSHPIVNSKDVEIGINIKNIGTKTSDKGAPLFAKLLGFAKEVPVQGGPMNAITPGETVIWTFHPYDSNDFFKVSDTAGEKTIQITLNEDHEITESNYLNNIFTQKVQMYSK